MSWLEWESHSTNVKPKGRRAKTRWSNDHIRQGRQSQVAHCGVFCQVFRLLAMLQQEDKNIGFRIKLFEYSVCVSKLFTGL